MDFGNARKYREGLNGSNGLKMVTGEMKVATVDVESSDNMATLPVGRTLGGVGGSQSDTAEKNNAANKEMELKNVMPKPLQRSVLGLSFSSGAKSIERKDFSLFV